MAPALAMSLVVSVTATAEDPWRLIESPHFNVISDAPEKQAKRIASELEMIRDVFASAMPGLHERPGPRLDVFAARNEKSLRRLLPQFAARDISALPGGVFFRTPDKNFVTLLVDTRSRNRYEIVYHEYYHSLSLPIMPLAPLWFQEGMAGLWEHTQIKRNTVETALPSPLYLMLLKERRPMPLRELLLVDRASADYRSGHRLGIFYAQSWALIHFIRFGDDTGKLRDGIDPYLNATSRGEDPLEAFETHFGAIDDIDKRLRSYIRRFRFRALRLDKPPRVADAELRSRELSEYERHARLGAYFAHLHRLEEAEAHVDQALGLNDTGAMAQEALGLVRVKQQRGGDAFEAFTTAARLDGSRPLPRFYLAALEADRIGGTHGDRKRVEEHLERAVALDPYHPPSLWRLSILYAEQPLRTGLALEMARRAATLMPDDPMSYLARGVSAMADGRFDEALAAFVQALRLDDGLDRARTEIAVLNEIRARPDSGTWQLARYADWIRLGSDARSVRCVIDTEGRLRTVTGKASGESIAWSNVSTEEPYAFVGSFLVVGPDEDQRAYRRVGAMSTECETEISNGSATRSP